MPISKVKRPYEFLVRWGANGIAGAHVQFIEEIVEDDVVHSAKTGDAIPVSLAGEAGFPLADILTQLHVDALATTSARIAEAEDMKGQVRAAQGERDHAAMEAEQLREQLKKAEATRLQLGEQLRQLGAAHTEALLAVAALRAAQDAKA